MGGETASLEPTTAPAIHDINETERKREDLRLFAKHGYTDKDETKFAKGVLEKDARQITDKEKMKLAEIKAIVKARAFHRARNQPDVPF